MKKRVIASLLCLAMGLSLVACGGSDTTTSTDTTDSAATEEKAEETTADDSAEEAPAEDTAAADEELHLHVTNKNNTILDPQKCGGATDYHIHSHLCEGLFKFETTGEAIGTNPNVAGSELVLGQAESYEYDETTMTYTFHLRDDIFWSDGEPVTAQHFVDGWMRLMDPVNATSQCQMFVGIVKNAREVYEGTLPVEELGVTAVDDKTLTIEMAAPCGYFTQLLAHYATQPIRVDEIEKYGDDYGYHAPYLTNGPFYISERTQDVSQTMVPNEHYYDRDKIGPDSITWYVCSNEATALAAFRSGDWQYISSLVPTDEIDILASEGVLFQAPYLAMSYLYCSTVNSSDWRVRAAYCLAIDRDNIVDNIVKNGSLASTGLIPEGITNSQGEAWIDYAGDIMWSWLAENYPDYDLTSYAGRVELAQALYAEAVADGWDSSKSQVYMYGDTEINALTAEAVQVDLQNALGVNFTLEGTIVWDEHYTLGRLSYTGKYNDPTTYFNCYGSEGQYELAYYDAEHGYAAEYDALLKEIKSLEGGVERDEKMLELEKLMFSDKGFSIIPLHGGSLVYVMDPDLKDVFYSPISSMTFFKYAHY